MGIDVIRVGLHASNDIRENMLAGGYHECLGEMVASKIMLNRITSYPPGKYQVYVNEKSISKLLGNKKSNLEELKTQVMKFLSNMITRLYYKRGEGRVNAFKIT